MKTIKDFKVNIKCDNCNNGSMYVINEVDDFVILECDKCSVLRKVNYDNLPKRKFIEYSDRCNEFLIKF